MLSLGRELRGGRERCAQRFYRAGGDPEQALEIIPCIFPTATVLEQIQLRSALLHLAPFSPRGRGSLPGFFCSLSAPLNPAAVRQKDKRQLTVVKAGCRLQ